MINVKKRKIMESNLFNVDEMNVNQLRDVVKMMMRLLNFETDRLTHLQDRVLQLELKQLNEEKECDHLWSVDLNGRHAPQCMKCMEHQKLTIDERKVDK